MLLNDLFVSRVLALRRLLEAGRLGQVCRPQTYSRIPALWRLVGRHGLER